MSRIIGCESLYIAEVTKDDATGTTWSKPEAVPSLISIEIQDQKDNVTFYSDDAIEQVIPTFAGKEVSIELGYMTNTLEAKLTGNTFADGAYVQEKDAQAREFAIMFKAPKSKGGYSYICLYKGVLSRDEASYKTKEDSIESSNITISGIFMPLLSNGQTYIKADSDETTPSTLIPTWFTAVPFKTGSSASEKAKK